jgi:hypothetical protein
LSQSLPSIVFHFASNGLPVRDLGLRGPRGILLQVLDECLQRGERQALVHEREIVLQEDAIVVAPFCSPIAAEMKSALDRLDVTPMPPAWGCARTDREDYPPGSASWWAHRLTSAIDDRRKAAEALARAVSGGAH